MLRCQIQEWYPRFRHASIKTGLVALPEEFVSYLLADGVFLPRSSEAMPSRTKITFPELQAPDYHHWDEEDADQDEPEVPAFPELEQEVAVCIEQLGGEVFPKLNWSSPGDSAWISTTGTLKCRNLSEISLLLKASDSIVYDLKHALEGCEDKSLDRPPTFYLALRKWYDLRPEMEFRGFVRGGVLVGVSQREITGFYPSVVEGEHELQNAVVDFFRNVLKGNFEAEDYTFDCYVLRNMKVKLLDFNPWAGPTLPLLFEWEELERNYQHAVLPVDSPQKPVVPGEAANGSSEGSGDGIRAIEQHMLDLGLRQDAEHLRTHVDFRIVKSEGLVQPGVKACVGVPHDFVETGPGSAWSEFLQRVEIDSKQQAQHAGDDG